MTSLVEQFGFDHDLVAFVGGGGKSTLALTLGREFADAGRRVVVGTTTKMGTDQIPPWATACRTPTEVETALAAGSPAFLFDSINGPKVIGAAPELASRIFSDLDAAVVIEADGARRRPFKAPGPDEPVIPSDATAVVVVAGIDALHRPIAESCHRPERVAALTGRGIDQTLRPRDIATVVNAPDGGRKRVPAAARLLLALTKVGAEHRTTVEEVTSLLPDDITVVAIPHS